MANLLLKELNLEFKHGCEILIIGLTTSLLLSQKPSFWRITESSAIMVTIQLRRMINAYIHISVNERVCE